MHSVGKLFNSTAGRNRPRKPAQASFCPGSLALQTEVSCHDQCGYSLATRGCGVISNNLHVLGRDGLVAFTFLSVTFRVFNFCF